MSFATPQLYQKMELPMPLVVRLSAVVNQCCARHNQ